MKTTPFKRSRIAVWDQLESSADAPHPEAVLTAYEDRDVLFTSIKQIPANPSETFSIVQAVTGYIDTNPSLTGILVNLSDFGRLSVHLCGELFLLHAFLKEKSKTLFVVLNPETNKLQPALVSQLKSKIPHCFQAKGSSAGILIPEPAKNTKP